MAQPSASRGLRSTRATARHRLTSDGGTSNVSDLESLRKTHLTLGKRVEQCATLRTVYAERAGESTGEDCSAESRGKEWVAPERRDPLDSTR